MIQSGKSIESAPDPPKKPMWKPHVRAGSGVREKQPYPDAIATVTHRHWRSKKEKVQVGFSNVVYVHALNDTHAPCYFGVDPVLNRGVKDL